MFLEIRNSPKMRASAFIIPVLVALVIVASIFLRSIFRAWLDHRVRMAILEKAEEKPELLRVFENLVREESPDKGHTKNTPRADLTLTGVSLTVIGLIFVFVNGLLGKSQWAVGAYFGGVACVVIGFVLASLGMRVRFLSRGPRRPNVNMR